jgi:hypothetical protein
MFYPFGYEKAVAKRINTVKTNIELCQAALASYAAHPGGKYPVGSFDYYQFHDLFPNNILPDILDEWFIEGSFLYDSEDGTTYIIWIEAPDLIRVTPSRVVPTRYDPQEAE